jgi:hypothetical protein
MKIRAFLWLAVLALVLGGCKKDDNGVAPTPTPTPEDFTFPADSLKFAITTYTANDTITAGASFDVKVILYNVSSAFGSSVEMSYPDANVEVLQVVVGPYFGGDLVTVSKIEPTLNRVSCGVSLRSGASVSSANKSAVVFKLKCRARLAGTASLVINPSKLEVRKSDGSFVTNFASMVIENKTLHIR